MPDLALNNTAVTISNTPGVSGDLVIAGPITRPDGIPVRDFTAAHNGKSFTITAACVNGEEQRTGCVYTHATRTLTRGTFDDSSTGVPIDLTSAAVVTVTMSAGFGNLLDTISRNAGYVFVTNSGASQSLTLNAWNRLKGSSESGVFDVETTDERGWWNAGIARFQPTLPGKYILSFSTVAQITTISASNVVVASAIYKNGVALGRGTRSEFYAAGSVSNAAGGSFSSLIVQMNGSTDYLEPWLYVGASAASAVTIAGVAAAHSLTAIYYGE